MAVHGRRGITISVIIVQDKTRKRLGKRVNFDKNRSVWGGNVDLIWVICNENFHW